MRIGTTVVELSALVLGELEEEACSKLHVILDIEVPCGKHTRLEVIDYAAGSFLAPLIAPIWVVLVVVSKPVCFVCARTSCSSFCGTAPSGDAQRMLIVEYLLSGQEVSQAIVEGSLDGCCLHVGPTIAYCAEESPTVFAETCTIGIHSSQCIVAIGSGKCYLMPGRHLACTKVVVAASTHSTEGEVIVLERSDIVFVTNSIVHAADCGIREATVLRIVHLNAIHVDVVVGIVQSTILEPNASPCPTYLAGIDIAC